MLQWNQYAIITYHKVTSEDSHARYAGGNLFGSMTNGPTERQRVNLFVLLHMRLLIMLKNEMTDH